MTRLLRPAVSWLLLSACVGGWASDPLMAEKVPAVVVAKAQMPLAAAPGFASERGGGYFVGPAGEVVRVGPTGLRAAMEAHPGNPIAPGLATALWPVSPSAALAVTSTGLAWADSGWLTAPPWQSALGAEGFVAAAAGPGGVGWLAHQSGLFQISGQQLAELRVDDGPITGLTALAAGPAPDGRPAVWFAHAGRLSCAVQTPSSGLRVFDSGLSPEEAASITTLAGVSASPASPGALWAMSPKALFQYNLRGWHQVGLPQAPRQLLSAGRFVWLLAGDTLYRYDADAERWKQVDGLAEAPTVLAVDAAGAAWVRVGEETLCIAFEVTPRISGLFQSETLHDTQVELTVTLPDTERPAALGYALDEGTEKAVALEASSPGTSAEAGLSRWSLAGLDPSGAPLPVSLAFLEDGLHTLSVRAEFAQGSTARRRVSFWLAAGGQASVSWERDVRELSEARCAKCHGSAGTSPALETYQQWKDAAGAVLASVAAGRMPADGPMAAVDVRTIERWVHGGTLP
jgi:hypothetical protein